jgi:hypothetical protein
MNKNSAKKRSTRVAKPNRKVTVARNNGATARKAIESARKPSSSSARTVPANPVASVGVSPPMTPAQLAYRRPSIRAHKFHVGQNVFYTSSPISRPGASGAYQVVKLLPSDGEDFQYRIKNAGEAFERVAKESQLENDR